MESKSPQGVDHPNAEKDAGQGETHSSKASDDSFRPFSGLSVWGVVQNRENVKSRTIAQIIFILFLTGLCLYYGLR